MSFLRPFTSGMLRLTRRAAFPLHQSPAYTRPLSTTLHRSFAQGYGDEGSNNSSAPTNSTQEGGEHPGPDAPADASASSGGSRSKEAKETGSSPTGGQVGNTGVGAQPKINDNSTPSADSEDYKKEVEEHNKDFEKRHDRASPAEGDKVDKKFWSGE